MNRVAEVNKVLRERGEEPRLRAGKGYYYFDGEATASWPRASVCVYRSAELSLAQWLEEYDSMKENAR